MVVYKKSDRIKVKVHGLEIELAPLSYEEKAEAQRHILGGSVESSMKGSIHAVKCAVKKIKGLTLSDGSEYELEFEADKLTDSCVDDLMNLSGVDELFVACLGLLNGVPEKFTNPMTGEELEGIEIVREKSEGKPKEKKSGS